MALRNRRQGLAFRQSIHDVSAYSVVYYNYSPAMQLKVEVSKGAIIQKDDCIGTLIKAGNIEQLLLPFSAWVTEVCKMPQISEGSTSTITLLNLEKCQHQPNPVPSEKGTDICIYCQETIWHYYEKETVNFTLRQIEKRLEVSQGNSTQQESLVNFQWLVSKNQHITKNTQIAKALEHDLKLDINGKVRYLGDPQDFNSENSPNSFLDKTFLSISKVICQHQKIIDQTCQFCLQRLEQAPLIYLFQQSQTGHTTSGRALQIEEEEYVASLVSNRKAILILDLDNTILNAISEVLIKEELEKYPDQLQDYLVLPFEYPAKFDDSKASTEMTRILVKIRPFFQEFLKGIVDLYDIFIYTKGTRSYAVAVCNAIREKYSQILSGTTHFKAFKMITRDEDPNLDKKSMEYVLPHRFQPIVILDDRRDIWDSTYCVYVKEYFYFKNDPETKKWRICEVTQKDAYLIYALETLQKIHKVFYQKIAKNQKNNLPSLKGPAISKVYHNMKKGLLQGIKAKFMLSGTTEENIKTHGLFRRAKRLGIQNSVEGIKPDIVIRSLKFEENRAKEMKHYSQDLKIPVVSQLWITFCYTYDFAFEKDPFILQDPLDPNISNENPIYQEILFETAIKLL